MSEFTTTAPAPSGAERRAYAAAMRRRAAARAADFTSGAQALFGVGFWVIFAVVLVAVPLIVDRAGGTMSRGVLEATPYAGRWTAFSIGVSVLDMGTATHLAAGGSRRALWVGTLAGAGAAGLVHGALFALAQAGERAVFGALGWEWVVPRGFAHLWGDGTTPYDPAALDGWAAIGVNAAGEALVVVVYALVGGTMAVLFTGVGSPFRSVLWAVPALLPLPAIELAVRSGVAREVLAEVAGWYAQPFDGGHAAATITTGVLTGIAVIALAAALLWARLRVHQPKQPA